MSIYSKNLNKVNDGYLKILSTIDSIMNPDQLQCISNMVDGWVDLMDMYCNEVYCDRSNKYRKKNADSLASVGEMLFNDIKQKFQEKIDSFNQEEYTGIYKTTRIKGINEICTEYYG